MCRNRARSRAPRNGASSCSARRSSPRNPPLADAGRDRGLQATPPHRRRPSGFLPLTYAFLLVKPAVVIDDAVTTLDQPGQPEEMSADRSFPPPRCSWHGSVGRGGLEVGET